MGANREDDGLAGRLRRLWGWVLVDANRWLVVGVLATFVFVSTLLVGLFGPVSAQQFLLEGTSTAEAYVEIQPAIITIATIVLAVNQLVLSPDIGPISTQRRRLEDVIDHRINVENEARVATSPTEPAKFLGTITDATRKRAATLEEAFDGGGDPDLRRRVREFTQDLTEEATRVGDALTDQRFREIEMLGAAMHYDTTRDISRLRTLLNESSGSLSTEQEHAMKDLLGVLELFTVSREYVRTLYVRTEFIGFSRALLYTALPAFLLAHFAIQIIGPNALPGTTLGVPDLLWYECATITATSVPFLVLISYVGRLVTLAETSVFIGPFLPGSGEQ
jgi:hypothetical protein